MERNVSAPVVLVIVMGLMLGAMLVGGCAAGAQAVGPQGAAGPDGSAGPQESAGPNGPVEPQGPIGSQGSIKPRGVAEAQETNHIQKRVAPAEHIEEQGRIGPADPVVFIARVLKTVGLAEKRG